MSNNKKYTMHVISGTHWDREWRHTAEQSKPRLADLIETMMDTLEKRPDFKTYCLDGGQVVLEDYFTVRPEQKERLKKLIKGGRVTLVNWYTLPETYTVAPEALLRNIMLGQKMAEEFGGTIRAGYTATSYGQTSQLPQIYQGFNITNAIFYRGTNKFIYSPLFLWEGLDGSRLHMLRTFDEVTRTNWFFFVHQPLVIGKTPADLTYQYQKEDRPVHMCDQDLYERGFKLTHEVPAFRDDPGSLKKALGYITEQAMPYAVNNHILALNMEDNDTPFELLPDMIEKMNGVSDDIEIVQSSLDEYMDAVTASTSNQDLPVHKGELRYTSIIQGSFNALLGTTHSSRVKLKVLNERAETYLMHHAEPLASISAMLGNEYPRSFLDRAWRHLLLNQAHDSICGAAVDQAHEDMLYNFSITQMVSEEITARSAIRIQNSIKTADVFNQEKDHTVTVFNTLPFARKQIVPLMIDLPNDELEFFDIIDENGNELAYKLLSTEAIKIGIERSLDTNGIKMPGVRRRILLEIEVPALGYKTCAVRPRGPRYIKHPEHGPDRKLMARPNGVLENEHLKVTINSNGTFSLLQKSTGHLMENMHYFTDCGQVGDAHLSKVPQRNPFQTSIGQTADITMIESNEMRGIYKIEMCLKIPAAATLDSRDRLREEKPLPITTWLTLEKDCKYLKMKTRLTNQSRDHKLRVHFPSRIQDDYAYSESAFAIEKRCVRWQDTADNREEFYPFQPMQNFVGISDGKKGLAVLNQGMREYEIEDDSDRTIALTLLRTQRAYMTANDMMTPDEFDKYTGLHSFGTHEFHYALYPHEGDWNKGNVLKAAYDHKVAMNAIQALPSDEGTLPPSGSFITIEPNDKLMMSALMQSQDKSGTILRVWNTSGKSFKGKIHVTLPVQSAYLCKLNEEILSEIPCSKNVLEFECKPHKIITLLLKG